MRYFSTFPARTFCECIEDMKEYINYVYMNKENKDHLMCLVTELHSHGKRMEAGLETQKTYWGLRDEIDKLNKKIKKEDK